MIYIQKREESNSKLINPELKKNIKLVFSLINVKAIDKNYRVKLYLNSNNSPCLIGQTEGINGNPILYSRTFDLVYYFEKQQNILIEIQENSKNTCENFTVNTTLAKIINYGKMNKTFPIMLSNRNPLDKNDLATDSPSHKLFDLKIDWFTIEESNQNFNINIQMLDLKYIDLKEDEKYFFVISSKLDGKNFRYLYKSEENLSNNFIFEYVDIPSLDLCLNDIEKDIKIDFYRLDDSTNGKSTILGFFIEKIKNLLISDNKRFNIFSPTDIKKNLGLIRIDLKKSPNATENNILNLIKKHNLNINLSIAIDFTNSNGDPTEKHSLHYKFGKTPNPYKKAILSIGKIIGEYDSDKKFPVYGFGAKIKPDDYVNQCFNINMNQNDPNIFGITEVIKTYENIFNYIELFGPTIFSEVLLNIWLNLEEERKNEQLSSLKNYHILLILTDGIIDDMLETKDYIVKLSNFPISIIIVGIGENDDFENMEILGKES